MLALGQSVAVDGQNKRTNGPWYQDVSTFEFDCKTWCGGVHRQHTQGAPRITHTFHLELGWHNLIILGTVNFESDQRSTQ